ncbi:type I-F CRISPR-associated protein Csy1 [Paraglaciecola sp. MB-3u-78]|uniref:type I-F CRISPR-associated protein Csy1 n=1 Tax=Paraglaciecola sp. MB-3u-78 TaxID=2058332 RepID=UPI000C32A234|nr:type I-F CRISPR-associated protein Csy1 [Paraglaciecola sp. MB-3u-78]PKG99344.1 type I-F CRISPR-associated protein Csy1 [Paraglaciecola sp. MB-3u-78]
MVDKEITAFFDERKTSWLKKNISATMSEVDVREKKLECESVFALKHWLPNAASRAGQITISTHPCTFSHPSSRKNKNGYASSIIANSKRVNDGFLRSGNVAVDADALGNAAALDVYKFLTLVMGDGQTLIEHLEQDTDLALSLLSLSNADESQNYQKLKHGFLAMTTGADESITSSKIKQVFFPVKEQSNGNPTDVNNYHLLSILTASGMVFELRKRLDGMRFGDAIKLARDKKKNNQQHEGYCEIYNLTTIGYGGTKPQNISVLNNQNGGKAHMFMSAPPQLKNRNIHFPHTDFFSQTVNYFQCKNQFYQLHKLYSRDDNNMHIRAERDEYYQSVIDHIIEKMWQVRSIALEQYNSSANQLQSSQKTWLCEDESSKTLRDTTDDWLDGIVKSVSIFLFYGYEKILGKKAVKFSDVEHIYIQQLVLLNKEALR